MSTICYSKLFKQERLLDIVLKPVELCRRASRMLYSATARLCRLDLSGGSLDYLFCVCFWDVALKPLVPETCTRTCVLAWSFCGLIRIIWKSLFHLFRWAAEPLLLASFSTLVAHAGMFQLFSGLCVSASPPYVSQLLYLLSLSVSILELSARVYLHNSASMLYSILLWP